MVVFGLTRTCDRHPVAVDEPVSSSVSVAVLLDLVIEVAVRCV